MVCQTSPSLKSCSIPYSRDGQGRGKRKHGRTIVTAGVFLLLTACGGREEVDKGADLFAHPAPVVEKPARVGLVVPLTGPHAAIGQRMQEAARLALPDGQSPALDVFDSAEAEGPAHAAQMALESGDKIVLGPLTAADTQAVASVLQSAHVPELAFTSDVTQARPGVWVMGLTPEQQVRRLVDAARTDGRKHLAAFLPDTAFGHALGEGLTLTCQEAGLDVPKIIYHSSDINDITQKMAQLSHGVAAAASPSTPTSTPTSTPAAPEPKEAGPSAEDPLAENDTPAASTSSSSPTASTASTASASSVPSVPFDALLLGDTGLDLAHVIEALKANQLLTPQIRILGPMLWRAFDGKLGDLHGAWYVAFDEQLRSGYVQTYQNSYHRPPSPVSDYAYDAAALAGALIRQNRLTTESLTQPKGYIGIDGLFHLRADGRMLRALGVYQIVPGGGSQIIIPASRDLTAPSALTTATPAATPAGKKAEEPKETPLPADF